jgi:hypothetical protein
MVIAAKKDRLSNPPIFVMRLQDIRHDDSNEKGIFYSPCVCNILDSDFFVGLQLFVMSASILQSKRV